ncbi:hypothetical protein COV82_01085 [Candidatus Peregrinibacteria bacterium CG11_big_fil_rev_8_21_14_0_20_46_8]|nr:MAG: hypothetical protein COV82_01085 [Candidatus Peregrinibacteria bacterium CG11_big_fil_rev_8_21_14_0_20_46_8]
MRCLSAIVDTLKCPPEAAKKSLAQSLEAGLRLAEGTGSGGDVVASSIRDMLGRNSLCSSAHDVREKILGDVRRAQMRERLQDRHVQLLEEVLNRWCEQYGGRIQRLLDDNYEQRVG